MKPIVAELEQELGLTFEKREVWNNEANADQFQKADNNRCGGVPFFWNDKTDKFICGGTDKETLKKLMLGE